MKIRPAVILGGGGHAKVLLDALLLRKIKVSGFVGPRSDAFRYGSRVLDHLGNDESFQSKYAPRKVRLVNGIGFTGGANLRRTLFVKFKSHGYSFVSAIHPSSVLARDAAFGEGVQIMAGAIIQTGSWIGENTILNTKASVDHDGVIGSHVHLAPGVTLCGNVHVGEGSFLGAGVVVKNGVKIGRNAFIPMGFVVTKDVADGEVVKNIFNKQKGS